MTHRHCISAVSALTTACVLGFVFLFAPSPALAKTKQDGNEKSTSASQTPEARIEERIVRLHKAFLITPEQEPAWNAFAQVMRSNIAMSALQDKYQQKGPGMTAGEALAAQVEMAEEHANYLRKLVPVLDALYKTMSDQQKRVADEMFGRHARKEGKAPKKGK